MSANHKLLAGAALLLSAASLSACGAQGQAGPGIGPAGPATQASVTIPGDRPQSNNPNPVDALYTGKMIASPVRQYKGGAPFQYKGEEVLWFEVIDGQVNLSLGIKDTVDGQVHQLCGMTSGGGSPEDKVSPGQAIASPSPFGDYGWYVGPETAVVNGALALTAPGHPTVHVFYGASIPSGGGLVLKSADGAVAATGKFL